MRMTRVNNDTFIQFVNNASWPERVTMDVKIAAVRGVVEVLGANKLDLQQAKRNRPLARNRV